MFKILEWITEAIGWLRIAISPLLIGLGTGAAVYYSKPTTLRLVIGICVTSAGLIVGMLWATKVWKSKKGTVGFLSGIIATPELDDKETETPEKIHDNKNKLSH
jgi:hypothetical protein